MSLKEDKKRCLPKKASNTGKKKVARVLKRDTKDNIQYYLIMVIPLILIFLFCYLPLFGIIIAFQDYVVGKPFFGEGVTWVGLKWFKQFVNSYYFTRILRNTLIINALELLLGFAVPIIFALVVNEIVSRRYQKFVQTVSYLPHFLSTVVVAGMVLSFIGNDGIITSILQALGFEAKSLNANAAAFPWIYVITSIWKSFGWNSIIYLSTISSIDPGLYEAASVDGATRMKKIWHITLPAMLPLIMIKLIMSIGGMLSANTDMILLLYNSSTYKTADVIGTYVYRESLLGGRYSYGTASGLLMSIFAFILTYIANRISDKATGFSMW